MQLSVFGLGHMGAVVAGCLVSRGHEVIAWDPDPARMEQLRRGIAPASEPGLEALVKQAVESGRLMMTTNVTEAIAGSALTNICIQATPLESGGLAEAICRQIGDALRDKDKFHSVVVRTALSPGATRGHVIPALEQASGKRAGVDFGIAIYPTPLRRGSAIRDCTHPPAILFGVTDDETLARLREMEIALQAPEQVVGLAEAERLAHPVDPALPRQPADRRSPSFQGLSLAPGNIGAAE